MFKNKYGEIRSGWPLSLSLAMVFLIQMGLGVVVAVLAMMQTGFDAVVNNPEAYTQAVMSITEAPWINFIMYTVMIGGLLLIFWLVYKRPVKELGLYAEGWIPQLLFGGLLGLALMALAVVLLLVTGNARLSGFNGAGIATGLFWLGFVRYLFVGFFEEILSRGLMMTVLKTTRNKWVIILTPAVLFGLLHILNNNVTVFSLANIALVGVLFAYLFIKTGRLWVPIGLHITWNFMQGYIWGIPVSGSGIPTCAFTTTVFTGPDWLTGGAFGIEGGAACTLVILLGLVFTHFFVCVPEQPDRFWQMDNHLPLTRGALADTTPEQ